MSATDSLFQFRSLLDSRGITGLRRALWIVLYRLAPKS